MHVLILHKTGGKDGGRKEGRKERKDDCVVIEVIKNFAVNIVNEIRKRENL